ncbi:hypothetical protein ACFX11_002021 [Malus domestica]
MGPVYEMKKKRYICKIRHRFKKVQEAAAIDGGSGKKTEQSLLLMNNHKREHKPMRKTMLPNVASEFLILFFFFDICSLPFFEMVDAHRTKNAFGDGKIKQIYSHAGNTKNTALSSKLVQQRTPSVASVPITQAAGHSD